MTRPGLPAASIVALLLMASPGAQGDVVGNGVQAKAFHVAGPAYATLGPMEDSFADPGFPHEPNHPFDKFPGASYGMDCPDAAQRFTGACNDYAGYRSQGSGSTNLLFADVKPYRVAYPANPRASWPLGGAGPLASWGSTPVQELGPTHLDATPHRARSLAPGAYMFGSPVGGWLDMDHTMTETVLIPTEPVHECFQATGLAGTVSCTYRTGFDGWLGNLVHTTEAYRYRGFLPETCQVAGVTAVHEHALCHPYMDGWISDPNAFSGPNSAGEFEGDCRHIDPSGPWPLAVRLEPLDGVWSVSVFVWRDFWTGSPPGLHSAGASIEDHTGIAGEVWLRARCTEGWLSATDLLLLPSGNLAEPIRTTLALRSWTGAHHLVEIDDYQGW